MLMSVYLSSLLFESVWCLCVYFGCIIGLSGRSKGIYSRHIAFFHLLIDSLLLFNDAWGGSARLHGTALAAFTAPGRAITPEMLRSALPHLIAQL